LPDYHLRFRSLAWEGDTVFEQNRELNFPTLEESLDKVGATVVICQFGQMESLAGKEKIPDFIAAYEKLLERFSNGGKRRLIVLAPFDFGMELRKQNAIYEFADKWKALQSHNNSVQAYAVAIADLCTKLHTQYLDVRDLRSPDIRPAWTWKGAVLQIQRDGCHLNDSGQRLVAQVVSDKLEIPALSVGERYNSDGLLDAIHAKNLLWFNYWRVQNWAFLAGDRTNQPSSRDWKDPSKRWFPAEREEFIPLIDAREKEIDALAAKLK
jgi:hypothetical protein